MLRQRVQIVEFIHGSAVTIQALNSDVILHVPDGVYGIILGNIHADHWRFRHLVPENDCIIGPMCEFHFKGSAIPVGARFRILVPHIVTNVVANLAHIKVQHQRANHEAFVDAFPTPKFPPQDSKAVYYNVETEHIEISSPHFCKFLVTAEAINCCSRSVEMLVFSKMVPGSEPFADVRFYFGSPHFKYEDYRQVRCLFAFALQEKLKYFIWSQSFTQMQFSHQHLLL